jgi:hypothetical protein
MSNHFPKTRDTFVIERLNLPVEPLHPKQSASGCSRWAYPKRWDLMDV